MLKYEGLRMMREMQILSNPGEFAEQKLSLHELMNADGQKTKPDGRPVELIDLLFDKRYAQREQDSDYYESEYYFSEEGSESSSTSEEEKEEDGGDEEEEDEMDEEHEETEEQLEELRANPVFIPRVEETVQVFEELLASQQVQNQ